MYEDKNDKPAKDAVKVAEVAPKKKRATKKKKSTKKKSK
jgi:hypothetical protein